MKTVKTARGRTIDMAALAKSHEEERAVSNVPVNARGDIIDNRGKVKVKKEKVVAQHYKEIVPDVEEVSIKKEATEPAPVPEKVTEPMEEPKPVQAKPKPKPTPPPAPAEEEVVEIARRERTREDGTQYWEIEYSDGSIETT